MNDRTDPARPTQEQILKSAEDSVWVINGVTGEGIAGYDQDDLARNAEHLRILLDRNDLEIPKDTRKRFEAAIAKAKS